MKAIMSIEYVMWRHVELCTFLDPDLTGVLRTPKYAQRGVDDYQMERTKTFAIHLLGRAGVGFNTFRSIHFVVFVCTSCNCSLELKSCKVPQDLG